MIHLQWCLGFSFRFTAVFLGAAAILLIGSDNGEEKLHDRFYKITVWLAMILSLTDILIMITQLYENAVVIQCILRLLYVVFDIPLFPVITAWLLYTCKEPLRRNPALYTVCSLQALKAAAVSAYFATDAYYKFNGITDVKNPFSYISLIFGIVFFIVITVILVRRWKKLTASQRIFFVICDLMTSEWMIIFMECFLIYDQNRRNRKNKEAIIRQQEEIIRQKEDLVKRETQVAVLQMRPHFIYNTLMSIYYLCQQDSVKAQKVILDFSRYLKKNFTAIVSEETVPFLEELEHTRAYLAVEKVRFEEKLYVEFDTPVTVFKLPPLTLQPIVENSVKYGVSPGLDPLYLSIITEESDEGVSVIVEDTGPGYAPSDDNEPHIALENIRKRLKTMCGGSLETTPREDGGTRVIIRIPIK